VARLIGCATIKRRVFRLAWAHNRWSDKTITVKDSIVVWWAGMMRGAVSVAMVYYRFDPKNEAQDKHAATIVVTTLQLVLYSTVGLGGITGPLLKVLLPSQVRGFLSHDQFMVHTKQTSRLQCRQLQVPPVCTWSQLCLCIPSRS
jgi:NhaP-type Na+/H+ or K+/H+ antiporter